MSNKNVKELVKNVIEENAVAFKQNLNRTLYNKVGQKLQEKYIEVSKNIFEMAGAEVTQANVAATDPSGFPANSAATNFLTGSKPNSKDGRLHPDPKDGPNGPVEKDYFESPYGTTRAPAREEFDSDEAFQRALTIYYGQLNRFLRALERYNRTRGL